MVDAANNSTLTTNLNQAPYYDDFSEEKNFHRILFVPGQAVQSRELTQVQSILQNQIDRFASHIFKEGSSVSGLEVAPLDTQYDYVKLRDNDASNLSVNVFSYLSKTIKGTTSGVIAKVVNVSDGSQANTPNYKTLFVDYVSSNAVTGLKRFANNEILFVVGSPSQRANTITGIMGGATGYGSSIRIAGGILFAKDHFIRVDDQTIILDKYTNTPSYRVGFMINEDIITSASDSTLLDPANGSYNYAAPGAHRLKLSATLTKLSESETEANNFVEYVRIKNGIIQTKSDVTQYNALRDQLAKRTYEESGDYIVRGLTTRIREHLNNELNQGVFTSPYGSATKLSVDVEPGKAYVQGYDNDILVTQHVEIDKGIDTNFISQGSSYADYGNYVIVDNVVGNWDLNGHDEVSLRGRNGAGSAQANAIFRGRFSGGNSPGTEIGRARVRGVELLSGTPGNQTAQYKLFLSDIRITTSGRSFANTESLHFAASAGQANGRADILNSNNLNANTIDQISTTAVFQLPASAIQRLRSQAGLVNTDYFFYKIFNASAFDSAGSMTLLSTSEGGSTSEVFPGTGALSASTARSNFYVVVRSASANTSNLTGTITVTSGSATVTGSGTNFTGQLNAGDVIACTPTDILVIASIGSATSLTLTQNAPTNRSGAFHKRFLQGQVLDPAGVGRNGNRSVTISSATSAVINLNETINQPVGGFNATVITKLNKINAQEASKTINRNRLVEIRIGSSGSTGYTANTSGPWPLGLADGFRLVSVRRKTGTRFTTTTEGTDVTSDFILDSGQRDSIYDHARLVKKPSSSLVIGASDRLLVTLDHFAHTNRDRGYFSIDSYPINDTTAAANSQVMFTYEVPVFTSPTTGLAYDLRNCIDFRPRLTDSANSVTTLTNISTNPLGIGTNVVALSANELAEPTGGLRFPAAGTLFEADMSYYLPRKDLITIDKDGRCSSIRGVSEANPKTPGADPTKMTLAVIDIAPYPSLPDEIARRANRGDLSNTLRTVKNERFTMRDIGVIRDRIDRLEYYTTLTLLEKEAKDLPIRDANGNDRFKNGFLVDSFIGHAVGNVYDLDYKIAVDPSRKEGRPLAKIDNLELMYKAADSTNVARTNVLSSGIARDQIVYVANSTIGFASGQRVTSGLVAGTIRHKVDNKLYIENATGNFGVGSEVGSTAGTATITRVETPTLGKLITLPYNHEVAITQPYATTTRNTSGLQYSWIGTVTLDPNTDYWVDTVTLPEVQVNIDNNADNWETIANAFGTQWGSWETVISGQPILSNTEVVDTVTNQTQTGNQLRTTTTTTNLQTYVATDVQQRVGTSLGVKLSTQNQTIGNVVRDTNIQPFMRSRIVRMTARAFKPGSRLYAFFDGINVTAFVTPTDSNYRPIGAEGSGIVTNSKGDAYGLFRVPNQDSIRFRRGEKIFRLSDSFTNEAAPGLVTTSGQTIYASEGLINNTQGVSIATTIADIAVNRLTDTRTLQNTTTATEQRTTETVSTIPNPPIPPEVPAPIVNNDPPFPVVEPAPITVLPRFGFPNDFFGERGLWGLFNGLRIDPIAQTFSIDTKASGRVSASGAFVTKVDLYFQSKDATLPVIVELREVDASSGYPTPRVLPYGRVVVESSQVNLSEDGSKPTPVTFPSPVYLQDGIQYAIVVIPGGGNPNYAAWISRLGETDLLSGNRISVQPATGMLFASSNDLTYTALQDEDLKFTLYFANFDVASSGTIVFRNEPKDYLTIANTSSSFGFGEVGEYVTGETYLKGVFVPGNNLTGNVALGRAYAQGMTSGATGQITYLSTANGEVRLRDVSSTRKFRGGEAIRFRLANSTTGTIAGNSTGTIRFATYPYGRVSYYDPTTSTLHLANVAFSNSGSVTGTSSNNRTFVSNRWIRSQKNGVNARIASVGSLNIDVLNVRGDFITPSNSSITTTGKFATGLNSIDSTFGTININRDTEFTSRRFVHSASNEANTSVTSSTMKEGSVQIAINLNSQSRFSTPVFDTTRISATVIENLVNNNVTGEANTSSGGSATAKYITRKVVLAEGQDAEDLLVYLEAYKPPGANIRVYYKITHREDSDSFAEARWIEMNQATATTAVSASDDKNDFRELQFVMPNYPTGAGQFHSGLFGNTNPTRVIAYRNSRGALYLGYKYFAIKIVLTGTNTTNPPKIRNLRAIALQK